MEVAIGIAVGFVILAAIGFFLPSKFRVSRSLLVHAELTHIHKHVVNLREWPNWGAWWKRSPDIKTHWSKEAEGVGAMMSWVDKSGEGQLKITNATYEGGIEYDLQFGERWKTKGGIQYEKQASGGVELTWWMQGSVGNPVFRYLMLFMNMDKAIGKDFEEGLKNLQEIAENE